jgi:uroporphyrinogen decarboxylase
VGATARLPGVNCVGLDTSADLADCLAHTPSCVALQGNLDPLLLLAGGPELVREIARIKKALEGRPHVFNLGHGILPPTPIENVETLIREVRAG